MLKILISNWKSSIYVNFLKRAGETTSHFYPFASQSEGNIGKHGLITKYCSGVCMPQCTVLRSLNTVFTKKN